MENENISHNTQFNLNLGQFKRSPKLNVFNWLADLPAAEKTTDLVEVQFKNTRKGYFLNSNQLKLVSGDIVAVEASPGHDIGIVTLIGELVLRQMRKNSIDTARYEIRRIYRVAKQTDIDKWKEARAKEHETMLKSRKIAEDLGLDMKIGDVEYQGDGNKAIFYYIAEDRVDFRQLIKSLAETFRIRIEMRQIGARQEAGRIGGIGPCGRELCCSSWMGKFVSVSTNAARFQELSINPQKLAGQCAKLKCCLNYELDVYIEAQDQLPDKNIPLETQKAKYYHIKTDVFKGLMTYSAYHDSSVNLITISAKRAWEVIQMNRKGNFPENLEAALTGKPIEKEMGFENVVGQDELTRFDTRKKDSRKFNNRRDRGNSNNRRPTNG